jgi:hypothetical protein
MNVFRWEGDDAEATLERAARARPVTRDGAGERTGDVRDVDLRQVENRDQMIHELPARHPA